LPVRQPTLRLALATFVAVVMAVCVVVAPVSAAPPATGGVTLPATCTSTTSTDPVSCTLQLVGFTTQNGTLQAVLQLTNNVTGQSTQILGDLTAVSQQQGGSCTLLDLTIQPIDLFLLGLHLHTDTIHLVLTAQRGTLLGNLLCGLFFGNPTGAATTLNQLLREGSIAVA
jgi:hypothetical protein